MGTASPSVRHRLGVTVTALFTATLAELADPGLCTAQLARRHHVSPRKLRRLFENEARGIEGLIRDMRLEAVRRDLTDPDMAGRTIGDVAARWCVIDASWLSRSFRVRYGMPPSQYRQAALTR
jgi:AraC-like DNA-binding protein